MGDQNKAETYIQEIGERAEKDFMTLLNCASKVLPGLPKDLTQVMQDKNLFSGNSNGWLDPGQWTAEYCKSEETRDLLISFIEARASVEASN